MQLPEGESDAELRRKAAIRREGRRREVEKEAAEALRRAVAAVEAGVVVGLRFFPVLSFIGGKTLCIT